MHGRLPLHREVEGSKGPEGSVKDSQVLRRPDDSAAHLHCHSHLRHCEAETHQDASPREEGDEGADVQV